MIKRTYILQLKKNASAERVRALIKILEDAPCYILTMQWSVVGRNLSRRPFDLIWDHGFKDLAGFLEYRSHPYHCNLIDEFMYKESPTCIIADSVSVFYDDKAKDPGTAAFPEESRWEGQHIGGGKQGYTGMINLLEQVQMKPGKTQEYLSLFASEYVPLATQRGMRLLGCWQSPAQAGLEEEVVFLWSIPSWHEWDKIRHQFSSDPRTNEWLAKVESLRTGGKRRFYEPAALSPLQGGRGTRPARKTLGRKSR